MQFTIAISFGLIFAYLAGLIGLAPIVGAFAAGLILDAVHFKHFKKPELCEEVEDEVSAGNAQVSQKVTDALRRHHHKHVEDLIEPVAQLFVPIFFVFTGMSVALETLFDPKVLGVALGITVVAFAGKLVSGLAAGDVNKWIVGWGMAPRGEVGLIFASIGKGLGVIDDTVFSVIVIMVILTTLMTPPILNSLLKKQSANAEA